MRRLAFPIFALVMAMGSLAAAEENWPQFRGPGGQGVSDATHLPLHIAEGQNLKWKTPIHGKAWSSPVIWKNQVWLTTATEDGHELSVLCVDKESGKVFLDKVLFHIAKPQFCIAFNSYASPTPCIEEGRVYVSFGSPGTACLDTRDFKVLWERTDFVCNHFRGAGSSPLLWNDRVIMNFDGSDFQFITALDKNTGKTLWRTDRSIDFKDLDGKGKPRADGDFRKAFSTPKIMDWEGKPLLLSVGSHAVYCYEPLSGKELWRTEHHDGHSGSLTPIFGEGFVFAGTGAGASELWAIRPGGSGLVNDSHVAWRFKKKVPTRPSPLLVDGLLYMVNEGGIVSCLEARSGQEIWTGRIDDGFSASPLYAAGRIYLLGEKGKIAVLAPGREFKILDETQTGSGFMACPAVSGDALFLRSRTELYCFQDSGK